MINGYADTLHEVPFKLDAVAFEALFEEYWLMLFETSFKYMGDETIAKDIVQDVFKSLWERRLGLKLDRSLIKGYLIRAVRNRVSDHYRTRALHQKHLEQVLSYMEGAGEYTENQLSLNRLSEKLSILIGNLPQERKQIFLMSRENGLSNREIADTLHLSVKTVENQLTRALRFIRSNLPEYFNH